MTFALKPLAAAMAVACAGTAGQAQSLPLNPVVANGRATINTFSDGMQIINTPGTIINWSGFSIDAGRTVRFDQSSSTSAVLNRVTGNSHSAIEGALQSNGRVFLINPNGILFGAGARVDTAGLIASTLDMSDDDFLAGTYKFTCANSIVCESGVDALQPFLNRVVLKDGSQITTRTVGPGGQVWLIARDRVVSEAGSSIDAPSGQVIGAAAREVTIASPRTGQMTFTLAGTAGSRVDLAGDIDVSRGAAGFFADTVRLAGMVRARADVGAAGQINADAASDLIVEGDARLDVSGNPGADAGAVRLSAVRTITVRPSVEINADGGAFVAGQPAAFGGVIELKATEVQLPGALSANAPSPIHARGLSGGSPTNDLAQYGRVNVLESGAFTWGLIEGPVFEGRSSGLTESVGPGCLGSPACVRSFSSNGSSTAGQPYDIVPSGDGRFLVLTREASFDADYGGTRPNTDVAFEFKGGTVVGSTIRATVIDAEGKVLRSFAVSASSMTVAPDRVPGFDGGIDATAIGLSKGGWMIHQKDKVHFIAPETFEMTSLASATVANGYQPLLGGGVLMTSRAGERIVYDAQGRQVADVAAALARENLTNVPPATKLEQLNLDERVVYVTPSPIGAEVNTDVVNVVARSSVSTQILETLPQRGTSIRASVHRTFILFDGTTIGAAEASGVTKLLTPVNELERYDRTNRFGIGTEGFASRKLTFDAFRVMSSNRVAFVSNDLSATSDSTITADSATRFQTRSTVSTSTGSSTVGLIARTLQSTPVAATSVAGALASPPLLATQPGFSNGERVAPPPPPPPPPPPVDPGPGVPVPDIPPDVEVPPEPLGALPPPYKPFIDPQDANRPTPGLSIPAEVVSAADYDDLLKSARDVVEDTLGEEEAARFDKATTAEERGKILQEAAVAQTLGPEMYDAMRYMSKDMRGAVLDALSKLQVEGLHDDEAFSLGLTKALTEKVYRGDNEDGSRGQTNTALFTPLSILEGELYQAQKLGPEGEGERTRIQNRIVRELVIAGKEAAGQEVDDTGDVVFERPDGSEVRISDEGDIRVERP